MKLRWALVLGLGAAACKGGCAREQAVAGGIVGFEGEIDEETTGSAPEKMTYLVKGVRTRLERPGKVTIWDGATKQVYRLDAARKVYTQGAYDYDAKPTDAGSAWSPTGKTDTIAGHRCQILTTTPKAPSKAHSEACLAEDVQAPGFGASEWTGLSGLRMRLVYFDGTGGETSRTEVTRLEPKAINSSEFEVPSGYTKVPKL
jgi:hypothetical protein